MPLWRPGGRDRYDDMFGNHAHAMVQSMWQHDIHAVAQYIKECMDVHGDLAPLSLASDAQ